MSGPVIEQLDPFVADELRTQVGVGNLKGAEFARNFLQRPKFASR